MTKADLVAKVAEANELTKKQAAAVIDSVLETVVDAVSAGDAVSLFGFGTFSVKHRDARQGRNPATGEFYPSFPLFMRKEDEAIASREKVINGIARIFADKIKQYEAECKRAGVMV